MLGESLSQVHSRIFSAISALEVDSDFRLQQISKAETDRRKRLDGGSGSTVTFESRLLSGREKLRPVPRLFNE